MNAQVVLYRDFVPSDVHFGAVEKNAKGGKFVPLAGPDRSRKRFAVQTPPLVMPFGVSAYREKPDADIQSYSIDVSFRNLESDPKAAQFLAKMRELDAHLLSCAVRESKAWFGKAKGKELLDDNYRRLIKDDPNGKYAPVMKVKIPLKQDGTPQCVFYEGTREISIDDIPKNATIKFILEVDRVWFVNNLFGVTWRGAVGVVTSRPSQMDIGCMIDDDDDAAVLGLSGGAGAGGAVDVEMGLAAPPAGFDAELS